MIDTPGYVKPRPEEDKVTPTISPLWLLAREEGWAQTEHLRAAYIVGGLTLRTAVELEDPPDGDLDTVRMGYLAPEVCVYDGPQRGFDALVDCLQATRLMSLANWRVVGWQPRRGSHIMHPILLGRN